MIITQSNRQLAYHDYLSHSWRWRIIRHVRLWLDGYKCCTCHATKAVQCHHASYVNLRMHWLAWLDVWTLAHELADTVTLCAECHERIHKNRSIMDFVD